MKMTAHSFLKLVALTTLAAAPLISTAQPVLPPPPPPAANQQIQLLRQFRPIGGVGNNLANPILNATPGKAERSLAPLNFAPGTNNGLVVGPNPRLISNVIAGSTSASGQDGQTTDAVYSAWIYVFGQFVDHDLGLESTPRDGPAINIIVPAGDPTLVQGTVIALNRAARDPATNTIINTTAGYLDLSQLYGSSQSTAESLRNVDGTLKTSADGKTLQVVKGAFLSGDPRVMENPEITATTTLFMREHNHWIGQLRLQHPTWTGGELYAMAREINIAEYQNIVYSEYLPALIGPVLGPYRGYDSHRNPQVSQEFSSAAFRVGHTQVSDTQEGIDNLGNSTFSQPLAQAFFNTAEMDVANGIDPLLRSLSLDHSQATDVYVVATLRNLLFADLVGGATETMDLIAIDIQRGRDVGINTLNRTRAAIGLRPYPGFGSLTSDANLLKNLAAAYGTIEMVDLFIGGLAEKHASGAMVGPTFQAIIAEQFTALREGDRFFWLNQGFDAATVDKITATTLADVILRNTDTVALQRYVFIQGSPPGVPQGRAMHVKHTALAPRALSIPAGR